MRVARKFAFLGLLLAATLFVQNASATIGTLMTLPYSTYAASVDNWQGYSLYTTGEFNLRIDFVVYDTENYGGDHPEEGELVDTLINDVGMTGRYLYVYEIFQPASGSPGDTTDLGYFGLLDKDDTAINGTDVNSISDDFAWNYYGLGQAPDENINTPIGWKWDASDALVTGEHSCFLAFSSNFAPIIGTYEVEEPESEENHDIPIPPDIPEPATLVLLGVGGAAILAKRGKSVR